MVAVLGQGECSNHECSNHPRFRRERLRHVGLALHSLSSLKSASSLRTSA